MNWDNDKEHLKRRDSFIADIVDVCKKHRVMLSPDGSEFDRSLVVDVEFYETNNLSPRAFHVSLADVEDAVRIAVWPIVHPEAAE